MSERYIVLVAEALKPALPKVVTKEELMNYYIHKLQFNGPIAAETTVKDLIAAAHIAGKQVKGKSRLEINVSLKEQIEYIKNSVANLDQEGFKSMMYANGEEIIKAYNKGALSKDLAKKYGCCVSTMNTYLKKLGVKMRKPGRQKTSSTITRFKVINGNEYTKYFDGVKVNAV